MERFENLFKLYLQNGWKFTWNKISVTTAPWEINMYMSLSKGMSTQVEP